MSGFKEWYNEDNFDLYNYPEEAIEEAWNHQQEKINLLEQKLAAKELSLENANNQIEKLREEKKQAYFK